jgi:hypothetical protein
VAEFGHSLLQQGEKELAGAQSKYLRVLSRARITTLFFRN